MLSVPQPIPAQKECFNFLCNIVPKHADMGYNLIFASKEISKNTVV